MFGFRAKSSIPDQGGTIRAARALVKFMREHGNNTSRVDLVEQCAIALERRDWKTAVKLYQQVPLGRMGCLDDWFPPPKFSNETVDYAWAVFEALVTSWNIQMRTLDKILRGELP
jgi:hypothetical protein